MADPRPYRPANGTEGMDFEALFCARCACDSEDLEEEDGCPILADVYASKVTDDDYPAQWVEDAGGPRCTPSRRRAPPTTPCPVIRRRAGR